MRKRQGYLALALIALSIAGPRLWAQSDKASDVDPDSVAALNKMGAYLRTFKAFQVDALTTTDEVLDNGQLVQFETKVNVLARIPNGLRVEMTSVQKHRFFFYDGKNFTIFAELANMYATVPVPNKLGDLADTLYDKYNIELPLEDLFFWGTPRAKGGDITGAYDVGPAEVGGVTCEQYAFRQKGIDWQIWIQEGDYPLPRKLVLTTLTDEARPQYSAVINWNLAPSFNEASFEFEPPKDAQKIALAEDNASSEEKK